MIDGLLKTHSICLIVMLLLAGAPTPVAAQSAAFTYQGKLSDNGNPANGSYDLQFKLFDSATVGTGTQQGTTQTLTNITISNGIFTVQLDFGSCPTCFNGAPRLPGKRQAACDSET